MRLQDLTDIHFDRSSRYWRDVYAEEGLQGLVYRERMQTALQWVDALGLKPGASVLEVGCGAGLATLELARRGYRVHSLDASAEMVALASRRIAEAGLDGDTTVVLADVHDLQNPDESFDLVLALGVLPWLHTPETALRQIARVLAPGARAIVSADNRLRLNGLTEPAENPIVTPPKYVWRAFRTLRGHRRSGAVSRLHTPRRVDRWLVDAGLEPERRTTVGFGPFTFFWRPMLSARLGVRLHLFLGRLAERRLPALRRHGWHYLVCARKAG